ncbi:unnamed protein product [Rotaria magnacalcarata]|uniref:RNA-directed DNA polymerase n=2 Tax=Rotaria magnacalcarata TaxID=392030 RepID=A0A816SGU8_9BILA|nr:unnamed protein product [Rotaria magnacalcarata]
MTDTTLLAKARKARFDDLPNFSGHSSEDDERFLKSIKNITKANDQSENHEILEIVRGKLIQSAEIDPQTSELMMIKHLMSGIHPEFQKELSRRGSTMNTLNEFLKYAKIEQDLNDTFENFHRLSIESTKPNFEINHRQIPSLTNMIERPKQQYQFMNKNNPRSHSFTTQRSDYKRNSNYQYEPRSTFTPNKNIQYNSHQHEFQPKIILIISYDHSHCLIIVEYVIHVNDQPTEAIIDTGSAISSIRLDFLKTIHHNNLIYQTKTCQTANSPPLNIIGHIKLEIKIKAVSTYVITHVATNLITSILLGNDWINSNHVHLFGDQNQLTIADQHGQLNFISYVEPTCTNYPALLVHQITIPPYSQVLVDITSSVNDANDFIFEPYEHHIPKSIFIPHTLLNINKHHAKVLLIDAHDRQQILSRNTRIGTISRETTYSIFTTTEFSTTQNSFLHENFQSSPRPLKNCNIRAVLNRQDNSNSTKLNITCDLCNAYFLSGNDLQKYLRAKCYSDQIRKHILESTKHIDNEKHRLAIQDILWRNKILFDPTSSIINIPSQSVIRTGDHPPIYSKQYSASYTDQDIKFQEIQKLLERGQIEESTSPWSSPIVLVKKKDKTMRFCIDYRRLNAITIKDAFPPPRIDEIFDQLSDAVYDTKFDFKSGYFQVPLSKEDRPKTALSTRDNHYQFTVLPQGITNGPATFQRIINHILGPARWKYALAYIDDVIIYSKTFEEHLIHLNDICTMLKNARFRLNPEKCEIAQTQTDYLGHNVKNGEIRPSSNNINGLLNTRLDELNAFDQLKQILTTDMVLRLPNNRFTFKVQTDASDEGIGVVLLQIYPEGDRPIAYLSKKFTQAQRKWSPMEQECYAFICSLDKWHNYLSGIKFTWETDHKALTQLNQKAQINKRCERWRLKILEYDYKVKYIPGLTNSMPDYLSRSPVDDAEEDSDEVSLLISKSTQTRFFRH